MQTPHNIQNYRREQCDRCPTPCQFQNDDGFKQEGDNECPIGRWQAYKLFVKTKWKGAGDAVASIAQPIAGVIDKVFKTSVKTCGACAKRREMLNQYLPFPGNR